MSIANAVLDDIEPTYGVQEARLDQEMSLAASESALMNKQPLAFPLRSPSKAEELIQDRFKETYGHDYTDIDHCSMSSIPAAKHYPGQKLHRVAAVEQPSTRKGSKLCSSWILKKRVFPAIS